MPLFMDVHNHLPEGATFADVTGAHAEDLKIQDQYGVRYLSYWVDAAGGKVFCLVDAPDADQAHAEDPERVTVAFLVAVGAAEQGRETLMFLTKEAVRLATAGVAVGTACDGCPPLPDLLNRYAAAGGRLLVCPICFNARKLVADGLLDNADLGGTVQLWQWIGEDHATTFSY
jgi:predicted peroxiredoxin